MENKSLRVSVALCDKFRQGPQGPISSARGPRLKSPWAMSAGARSAGPGG